jgi:hypothetical protein
MGDVLSAIGRLPNPDHYRNKVLTISDIHLRFAVADVIRRRWVPGMDISVFGKKPKAATRNLAKAEGLVLSKLLSIVSEVFLFDPCGYSHPAYWWLDCCLEPSAHRPFLYEDDAKTATKAGLKESYQSATAALKQRQNPFADGASKALFDRAIELAEPHTNCSDHRESDLFYPSKFLPYLEARAKLAGLSREKTLKITKEKSR